MREFISTMQRAGGALAVAAVVVVASAHVGSPNAVFDGSAGPFPVRVVVKPPDVVPGLAEVIVRVDEKVASDVQRVVIRPVFWRAGEKGAPQGDDAPRVAGQSNVYAGQLWLMSRGSYSVYVNVSGTRGNGTAIVPVNAFATGRLALSKPLAATLVVLGGVLFVGLVTIVRAAAGESLVAPGERIDKARAHSANRTAFIFAPILALILFGGAKWWNSVDAAYARTMYKPPEAAVTVASDRTLTLTLRDTAAFKALFASVIPDHGKMMHLFLVKDGDMSSFAHLHPTQTEPYGFTTVVPELPAGRYRLFGDVTLENGTSLTVSNTVELPATDHAIQARDEDDAWSVNSSVENISATASETLDAAKHTMGWVGTPSPLVANQPVDLAFQVKNADGSAATLQPYLGMSAHAVVMRDDGSVFIHLHPMGTISTASQEVFQLRDRGDTTTNGHLKMPSGAYGMPHMPRMSSSGAFTIPYEFPKVGRYRVWVQVKVDGRVLTGAFDAVVH